MNLHNIFYVTIDELRSNREKAYDYMEGIFRRWQSEKDRNFDYWYNEERESEAGVIIELHAMDLQNIARAYLGIVPLQIGTLLPGFATRLIFEIKDKLKDKGIIGEENLSKKAGEFLRSKTFKDTPYIKISSMLYAAMARRAAYCKRKKPPGRGFFTDVKIISTLLPYCDAMFIDNECRSLLLEKPLCDEIDYGTKIFSLSNKEEFLKYLNDIRKCASEKHMKAVTEVYGSDWNKPQRDNRKIS